MITSLKAELKGAHVHVAVFVKGGLSGTLVVRKEDYGALESLLRPEHAPEIGQCFDRDLEESAVKIGLDTVYGLQRHPVTSRLATLTGIARMLMKEIAQSERLPFELLAIRLAQRLIDGERAKPTPLGRAPLGEQN